jgi:phasin family protein
MFEQMNEQFKTAMKPMSDLASLNLSTMQSLAEKQTELYSTMMSESMNYFEQLSGKKDVMAVAETQKAYVESMQEKMADTAKSSYSIMSEAQEKAGEMVKGMSDSMTSSFANATKK